MPDHWGYVATAYAVAALAIGGYLRWLAARGRALRRRPAAPGRERRAG